MRHSSPFLTILTISVVTGFLLIQVIAAPIADSVAIWVLLASVVVIGIPHGAIDHIMASELYGLNQTLKDHLIFYSSYLLVMMIIGALWVLLPVAGMILFLIISVYHFGQADMEDFMTGRHRGFRIHYLNRGWLIIGLIIFSDPSVTVPIIADAVQTDPSELSGHLPGASTAVFSTLGIYTAISAAGILSGTIQNSLTYFFDSLLLIACLLGTGPLIGFAIYFALWHSAGHIREMISFFESRNKPLTIARFYKKAAPFTLISFAGLALLFQVNTLLSLDNQFITLMFILISVLTLPHMFIVERMYDEKSQTESTAKEASKSL
ncbi:MAG: Brp/Blh family beta-carotene 15,15'-dioxygenase [Balneolaceae bacterium]